MPRHKHCLPDEAYWPSHHSGPARLADSGFLRHPRGQFAQLDQRKHFRVENRMCRRRGLARYPGCRHLTSRREAGASKLYAILTHGIFSGPAFTRINKWCFEAVRRCHQHHPTGRAKLECPKIRCINVSMMFAEAVRRTHNNESVSYFYPTCRTNPSCRCHGSRHND